MFEFNDAYIGIVAGGQSDEDTLSLLQTGFEEMASELQSRLPEGHELEWDEDGPYVELDEDEMRSEYGIDQAANPVVTQAFIQSRREAAQAFSEVVSE